MEDRQIDLVLITQSKSQTGPEIAGRWGFERTLLSRTSESESRECGLCVVYMTELRAIRGIFKGGNGQMSCKDNEEVS